MRGEARLAILIAVEARTQRDVRLDRIMFCDVYSVMCINKTDKKEITPTVTECHNY